MSRFYIALLCLVAVSLACVNPPWTATAPTITPTATRFVLATRTTEPAATSQVSVTATRSLNVRVRPGERERVIGYLYSGDPVTLIGKCQNGWAQIKFKNQAAWVNARYLSDNRCKEKE